MIGEMFLENIFIILCIHDVCTHVLFRYTVLYILLLNAFYHHYAFSVVLYELPSWYEGMRQLLNAKK